MTPRVVALLIGLLAAVAAWQVTVIPVPLMQQAVGPVVFPAAVVASLVVLAAMYGWRSWRDHEVDLSLEEGQTPLPGATARMAWLLGGGVAFIGLVGPLGFVVPGTLCGMGVAKAFDAPLGGRSLLVCGGVAAGFWLLFAQVLGVGLGPALPWLF